MSVRARVVVELGIIAVLTAVFLLLFPKRNPLLDVALAGFALLCITLSASYTKRVIWAASPAPVRDHRIKRCLAVSLWITVPVALVFLMIGGIIAYHSGGWAGVGSRVFNGECWRRSAVIYPGH